MALNKYGYRIVGLKKACSMTKCLDGKSYASIYYDFLTGGVDVVCAPTPAREMRIGNKLLVVCTNTPMTMQQITNEIVTTMLTFAKD